jgi:Ca2+-binding RTX toxin-like protein
MAISTNGTIITRLAGALYGEYLSNASYTEVKETAAATVAADMIKNDFAGKTDAQLAAAILTNLGLTSVTGLDNWVAAQLTAAGSSASAKGAKLVEMLNGYANMTADATYGASATSFNAKVEASLVLSQTAGTKAGAFGTANADKNQTITLTEDLETVEGGAASDRFIASYGSTLDSGDSIVGGDGTDTLSISVTGSDVTAETISILASGIEKITIANTETDTDDVTFDLASAGSSVATVGTYASTAAGDTSFTNVGSIVAIEAAGKGDVSVSYTTGVTSGAADVQSITLNGAGTSSSSRATITSAGIETINLASNGSSNFVTITDSSLKTLNVTGSKALTVSNDSTFLTTVDASASTGSLTLLEPAATNITVTGGAGNDKVRIDGSSISTSDSVNVGDGVDTLELTAATNVGSATAGAVLKGFENLYGYRSASTTDAADFTVSQAVSFVSGVTTIGTASWTVVETDTAEDDQADGVTFTSVPATVTTLNVSGISYSSTDAAGEGDLDFTASVTLAADTTSDSLSVVLGSATTAALTQVGTQADSTILVSVNDIENLTITSQGGDNTVTTLTAGDLATLTVNAAKALTISSIASVTGAFKTINASDSTANVVISTAIQGAGSITGGSGNDTFTGSSYADNITGGDGNDVITSGGGNDTILGGAGNDSITNSSTTSTNKVSINGGEGDDTITGGTGNDTMDGGAGTDVFDFTLTETAEAWAFSTLTSNDVVIGGEGNDSIRLSGDNEDATATLDLSSSSVTTFSGVSGVERITVNFDDDVDENGTGGDVTGVTISLGDVALGSFNNDLTINASTGADYPITVDASTVYNSSSKVTASAKSGEVLTYSVGNGIDKATGSSAADVFNITNNVFLQATDTLTGGAGNDSVTFSDANGGTITTKMSVFSAVESVSIDTTGAGNFTLVFDDTMVGSNYNTTDNKWTVARDAADTGTTKLDATAVSSAYNLVLAAGTGYSSSSGGGDTLIGGAGNDTITGGAGRGGDVITLTAGGVDRVRYTAAADGEINDGDAEDADESSDNITGFTTYTSSGSSTAAQTGYDIFVFTAEDSSDEADIFDAGTGIVLGDTAPTTTAGTLVTLNEADYNEINGSSSAAGTGLADDHINVIKGRGYSSFEEAINYNGVDADDGEDTTGTDLAMVVVFYNTSTARTEMWYTPDADSDDEDSAFTIDNASLLAYSTDITLTGIGGFGYQNFAVESIG